jgi:Uma2 family endonuclease
MNMRTRPEVSTVDVAFDGYRRRPFTKDEYYRMSELGFFNGQRVQLIGGEIVQMAAQSNLHQLGIGLVYDALVAAFGPNFWVRSQGSLDLSPLSVPDPDLAVVPGSKRSYIGNNTNPTKAVLIVEVCVTTLSDDRNRKASLYAAAGIADYWILNVDDRQLEIRRDPKPDATQEFGHGYSTLTTLAAGDFATPLAAPAARIAVADLLPA